MLIVAFALLFFALFWGFLAWRRQRFDMADIAWGIAPIIAVWLMLWQYGASATGLTIAILVSLWGLRLVAYIAWRRRHTVEDFRYKQLRDCWQQALLSNFIIKVVLLQSILAFILALPALWIVLQGKSIDLTHILPLCLLWAVGFIFEAVADIQLQKHKRLSPGTLMQQGLWSLSRHPNIFGELLQWWSIAIIVLETSYGIYFMASPILISWIVLRFSAVEPLERRMQAKDNYREYCNTTPKLIPLFAASAAIYGVCWMYVARSTDVPTVLPLLMCCGGIACMVPLAKKYRPTLVAAALPTALLFTAVGVLLESLLHGLNVLSYGFSAVATLGLYPLFAVSLLTGFVSLRLAAWQPPLVGGLGALTTYWGAQQLGSVTVNHWWLLVALWSGSFTAMWHYLVKVKEISTTFTDSPRLQQPLQVIFDGCCPICSREKTHLQSRNQTGKVIYSCPISADELAQQRPDLSYHKAMSSIHAYLGEQELTGVDALAELYARTDLLWLSVLLKAPIFYAAAKLFYAIWARLRPREDRR